MAVPVMAGAGSSHVSVEVALSAAPGGDRLTAGSIAGLVRSGALQLKAGGQRVTAG